MDGNHELNNGASNQFNVQHELEEADFHKKSKGSREKEKNVSFEVENYSNNYTGIITSDTLKEKCAELELKNKEQEGKISTHFSSDTKNMLSRTIREKDSKSDKGKDEYNGEVTNYSDSDIVNVPKEIIEKKDRKLNQEVDEHNSFNDETDSLFNKSMREKDENSDKENDGHKNNDINKRLSKLIDSDSEDENIFTFKSKKRYVYNESDDEKFVSEHNSKSKKHLQKSIAKDLSDNDSNNSDTEKTVANKSNITSSVVHKFQTLIDSESEEEDRRDDEESLSPVKPNKKSKKNKEDAKPKMKVSLRASKEEAMRQIQSETQRLLRESEISLPYHKPKQRTLKEFLKRKKVSTILPKAPTMAAKLKMSSAIVEEVLKEKEKEAEIFYKSSDSEEDEKETIRVETIKETINNSNANVESTSDVQKDHVSRQLFLDNDTSTSGNNTSAVDAMDVTLVEMNEMETNRMLTNDGRENNIDNLTILEPHQEFTVGENKDEDNLRSKESSKLVQEDIEKDIEIENKEENISIDTNKYNSEITNKETQPSTSKNYNDYAAVVKQSLGMNTDEFEEYNEYGLPPPKIDDSPNVNAKKTLWNVKSLKPKLRGIPGSVIDLTDDIKPSKKKINDLIDRFMSKHSNDKFTKQAKDIPNALPIIKETLPYRLSNAGEEDPKLNKPGAKLLRLKEDLKHKMALKRDEEWKQREQEMKEQEIEWNESINEEDNFNESFSPDIESQKSEDVEFEELDDAYAKKQKKKKKKKSAFIEDEAEVSEDDINDSDEIEDENEDEDEAEESAKEDDEYEEITEDGDDSNNASAKRRTFRRIVEPLEEDSLHSLVENDENNKSKKTSCSQVTSMDMFSSTNENKDMSDNESDLVISQADVENYSKQQMSQITQTKSSTFDFIFPLTQLTALDVHSQQEKKQTEGEKSLFTDDMDTTLMAEMQDKELFQQTEDFRKQGVMQEKLFGDQEEPNVSDSQLLELCSGTFSSQTNSGKELIDSSANIPQSVQVSTEKYLELTKNNEQKPEKETATWNQLRVLSSDEEDIAEKEAKKRSKKKVNKLNLSDDEEEEDSCMEDNEDEEQEEDEEKFVDYDSEENEVVVPKKDIKKYAATFLEEEAELSESDCEVSADEDEQDLDKFEVEDADNEEIDETQVKDQVGKLHMRQLLDEDQKEVKMLQELLFEDGDLYSESKRERKFKWRNIDKQDDNNESQPLEDKDGWVDLSDNEDEIKWRKMRYERDKFLAEKKKNIDVDIENDLQTSRVFKLGMKVLKKRRLDDKSEKEDTLVEDLELKDKSTMLPTIAQMMSSKLEGKSRTIHNIMQRHSFLARGEESLARLAALAKQKDVSLPSLKAKNFVFAHIDSTTEKEGTSLVKPEINRNFRNKRNR